MGTSFAIVTDSTCDLPESYLKDRKIHVVPQYVLWGTESYRDGIDLTSEAFYERLSTDSESPKTSQPAVGDFVEHYRKARDEANADGVLAVVVSAGVSGTYNSAIQAAEQVDFPVKVVDSRIASIGLGFLALEAADARDANKSLDEAYDHVQAAVPNCQIYFTVATLEYLHRGGRIGGASRFLGDTLKIKPILYRVDGKVEAKDRVRTAKRAMRKIVDLVREDTSGRRIKRLGIMHAEAPDDVATLKELLSEFDCDELIVTTVCTAVGVHGGPGLYGASYQVE